MSSKTFEELTIKEIKEKLENNSGNENSGNRNSGYGNSGDWNSGDWNSGNRNSGNGNSGDWNSGDWNSGDWNSGNRNSGYGNSGYGNSGLFNTNTATLTIFNKPSNLTYEHNTTKNIIRIISSIKPVCVWIEEQNMTNKEKKDNPSYKTTGGYLKKRDYKYCWKKGWEKMSEEDKKTIKSLPNFCPKIFEEITGINVEK